MELEGAKFYVWQCQNCHYEYEEERGDPVQDIVPGTRFEDLPYDWVCPVCGAEKERFKRADLVSDL